MRATSSSSWLRSSAVAAVGAPTSHRRAARIQPSSMPPSPRRTSCSRRDTRVAETAPVAPTLTFANPTHFRALLGNHDEHIRLLERALDVRIEVGEGTLALTGDAIDTELAGRVLDQLYALIE